MRGAVRSSDPVTGVIIKASVAPSPISTSRRSPTQRRLRVVTLTGKKTTFIRPSFEQRVDELARVEGDEVSAVSPRPTSFTGMPSSVWMANTMPPLAEPSSLVSTTPVTSTASVNCRGLGQAVLAGGGVDHEQHLGHVPGARLGDPAHLAQLLHQVDLGVQAPGGVGQHEVGAARRRPARRRRR